MAKSFLDILVPDNQYYGIDYEEAFAPDAVVDLFDYSSVAAAMQANHDAIMILDVLEHLTDDVGELEDIMSNIARCTPKDSWVVITLPQMYRLDRLKLSHLHYPEHKIRLTQKEWLASLTKHFSVHSVQGLGYLSVFPYLPMLSKKYASHSKYERLFMHLRSQTFEKDFLKPTDLFLSNTLGKLPILKHWSNDFLVVARARQHANAE
ncbi:MAG: methyltransferase [Gammaproteobacteria bacterium]|nr:methyltransferase [Gammaproteobacteria bacterium]